MDERVTALKAIMVMFDSLNRHMLPPYGCDWTHLPHFRRLAERTVVLDRCYVGSMPCMPARRELHTGRYNFLHRGWGPIEPFDDSMPELLKQNGVYTHLATDHQHYWEDGGGTYHYRYSSFEFFRGQEGDAWKGEVAEPDRPQALGSHRNDPLARQDWINRKYIREQHQFPQAKTFDAGLAFIRQNQHEDRWFLQIETFDPHEPFYAPDSFKQQYPHSYHGEHFDWPAYTPVQESPAEVEHVRFEYAALLGMCDEHLGKVLDLMDELSLWEDTLLIVNTDHGLLLGEHGWWAKSVQPFYNEIAHIPLFIWDPRCGLKGQRRSSLVQTIDLAPTLLEFFGVNIPRDMQGKPLSGVIEHDRPIRRAALFGIHGGHVNCVDGRYVYMRAPSGSDHAPLFHYTWMPTHMNRRFSIDELRNVELVEGFSFTKGIKVARIRANPGIQPHRFGTLLFDLDHDPGQEHPIDDPEVEKMMVDHLVRLMKANDSPPEQFERLGLHVPSP